MKLRRFAEHYRTAAVVILNTLILTALVLVVLHFAFPLESSVWRRLSRGPSTREALCLLCPAITGCATRMR